jgi:hypothetical protein
MRAVAFSEVFVFLCRNRNPWNPKILTIYGIPILLIKVKEAVLLR